MSWRYTLNLGSYLKLLRSRLARSLLIRKPIIYFIRNYSNKEAIAMQAVDQLGKIYLWLRNLMLVLYVLMMNGAPKSVNLCMKNWLQSLTSLRISTSCTTLSRQHPGPSQLPSLHQTRSILWIRFAQLQAITVWGLRCWGQTISKVLRNMRDTIWIRISMITWRVHSWKWTLRNL